MPAPALVVGQQPPPPPGATWAAPAKYTNRLVFRFDGVGEVPPGYTHLFVVPSEGGTARQLTTGDYNDGGGFGGSSASWSPDGLAIVIAANRRPDAERNMLETDLFAVQVKDGSMKQLTDRFGPDGSAEVSPDGKLIAFLGFDDRKVGYQNTLLYLMNWDGSGKRVLSSKLDQSVSSVVWAADGKSLYLDFDEKGNTKVASMTLDGNYRVVAKDLGTGGSAYGGGSFSVAKDGSIAFTMSTPSVPGDIAVIRPTQAVRVITSVNADVMADRQLGQVEELW